jgi:hypothetical protein
MRVIGLEVRRFLDLEALEHGMTLFSFRVWTRAQFKRRTGWTPVLPALLDTGAPFSVLPATLWPDVESDVKFTTTLRGLVPLPSAMLKARLAQVSCLISDSTTSVPLRIWALLAEGNVPLVLGCAGILDQAKLALDAARQIGHLAFPS